MARLNVKSGIFVVVLSVFLLGLSIPCFADDAISGPGVSCAPPPKAKPQRMTGGESVPPLPLPATTMRRTERKREPSPPVLVTKMAYGKTVWMERDGKKVQYRDWTTDPDDMNQLLRWVSSKLNIKYKSQDSSLQKFSYDPSGVPIMYFTGHQAIPEFSEEARARIRQFVIDGGTILGDACCGSETFSHSFRREMAAIFPKRELAPLPLDHPVFSSFYKLDSVRVKKDENQTMENAPYLEGLNIGCRTAVFFSPIDCSCGWDGHIHDNRKGMWYSINSARALGANVVTYILANYQYGRMFSTMPQYYQEGAKTRGEFVFAQIRHNGEWDPTPHGIPNLLKFLQDNSTVSTKFKRVEIDFANLDPFETPIVYMTGLREPRLADADRERLKYFLNNGGVLLVDASCGRKTFDQAFRGELKKIFPDRSLQPISLDHPMFKTVFDVKTVKYEPLLQNEDPNLNRPVLEGIIKDGQLVVIYSPYALGAGWEQLPNPYNRGYASLDAMKLGVNALVYAMTH
jgi:hypothetical protein